MSSEKLNFDINIEGGEVVIRQGEALPVFRPKGYNIDGQMGSCLEFASKRKPDPKHTVVIVKRDAAQIQLKVGTHLPKEEQIIISDQLQFHQHYAELGIEKKKFSDPAELGELLRRRKRYFANAEKGMKVISALKNFSSKVESQIEKLDDKHAGKYRAVVDKVVQSNLPEGFILKMPIFKGVEPKEFKVELLIDVRDRAVSIWMESIELEEIIQETIDYAIEKELVFLKEHFVTIEV